MRYSIDKNHCNPKKVWTEMGKPTDMTPTQIAEIKEKSALQKEPVSYEMQGNTLTISDDIGVNDVHCYIIKI